MSLRTPVRSERRDAVEVFEVMTAHRARYPVEIMSRSPGVSRSGFSAWQSREPSARDVADRERTELVRQIHAASRERYSAPRFHAELAMTMAIGQRTPSDVLHHSDQGAHDASGACGLGGRTAGVRSSRGSVRDAYDTATCDSVLATPEGALPARRTLSPKADARMAIFEVIEGWHTPRRRPSARGSLSPIDDEGRALETLEPSGP